MRRRSLAAPSETTESPLTRSVHGFERGGNAEVLELAGGAGEEDFGDQQQVRKAAYDAELRQRFVLVVRVVCRALVPSRTRVTAS